MTEELIPAESSDLEQRIELSLNRNIDKPNNTGNPQTASYKLACLGDAILYGFHGIPPIMMSALTGTISAICLCPHIYNVIDPGWQYDGRDMGGPALRCGAVGALLGYILGSIGAYSDLKESGYTPTQRSQAIAGKIMDAYHSAMDFKVDTSRFWDNLSTRRSRSPAYQVSSAAIPALSIDESVRAPTPKTWMQKLGIDRNNGYSHSEQRVVPEPTTLQADSNVPLLCPTQSEPLERHALPEEHAARAQSYAVPITHKQY